MTNEKRPTLIAAAGHRGDTPAASSVAQSGNAHAMTPLRAGSTIAYLPPEAGGDVAHPLVEHGRIISTEGDTAYVLLYYAGTRIRKTATPVPVPLSSLARRKGWKVTPIP